MFIRWVILIAGDAILAAAALYSASVMILGNFEVSTKLPESATIVTTCVFILVILFSAHLMEAYDLRRNTKKSEVLLNVLFGTFTAFFLLSVVYYLDPEVVLGRGILIYSLLLFAMLQFVWLNAGITSLRKLTGAGFSIPVTVTVVAASMLPKRATILAAPLPRGSTCP